MIENFLLSLAANILTSHAAFVFAVVLVVYIFDFWCLWVVTNIAHTRLHRLVYAALMWAAILIGGLADVFFQCTFAWLLFFERPREATLSMRLTRYLHTYGPYGMAPRNLIGRYRLRLAVWFATHLIEPWSPGHIGLVRLGFPPAKDQISPTLKQYPLASEQFALMGLLLASAVSVTAAAWLVL